MHYDIPVREGKKTIERDLKRGLKIGWRSEESIICRLGQSLTIINFPQFMNEKIEAKGLGLSKSTWLLNTKSISLQSLCLPTMNVAVKKVNDFAQNSNVCTVM